MKKRINAIVVVIALIAALAAGCAGAPAATEPPQKKEADVQKLLGDIIAAMGDEQPVFMDVTDVDLENFYGINKADVKQYAGKMPMMIVRADEVFIAEAQNGKADALKTALEKRQQAVEETFSTYLPQMYEMAKNYRIVVNGDYVMLVMSEDPDKAVEIFDSATK